MTKVQIYALAYIVGAILAITGAIVWGFVEG